MRPRVEAANQSRLSARPGAGPRPRRLRGLRAGHARILPEVSAHSGAKAESVTPAAGPSRQPAEFLGRGPHPSRGGRGRGVRPLESPDAMPLVPPGPYGPAAPAAEEEKRRRLQDSGQGPPFRVPGSGLKVVCIKHFRSIESRATEKGTRRTQKFFLPRIHTKIGEIRGQVFSVVSACLFPWQKTDTTHPISCILHPVSCILYPEGCRCKIFTSRNASGA